MLRTNLLKQKLRTGEPVYGLISSIPSPAAIELIAEAGFDFVIIDMEHVLINPETVENMIRTAESYAMTPLVRVADLNPKTLLRLLDGGAQGIVLPMIESPESLAESIRACKYHPQGTRSLNAGRPGAFGKHSLAEYVALANEQIMVVAMIESAEGVRRAAEIAAMPGLDMILEGAADLSQSMGLPWQIDRPEVQQALLSSWQAASAAGVPYCAIPRQPGDHERWLARGVKSFVLGDERGIAFRALQAKLAATSAEGNNRMNFTAMAADRVMQDLVDCLLAEHFFGTEPLNLVAPSSSADQLFTGLSAEQRIWEWPSEPQGCIVIALRPGITQQWEKVPGTPVWARQNDQLTALSPEAFTTQVLAGMTDRYPDNEKGFALFLDVLRTSVRQTELSLAHRVDSERLLEKSNADFFLTMEQWASLRDRPYHPLAKAKQGLSETEYQQYQAEFARPVALNWVAVDRTLLQCGDGVTDLAQSYPAQYLLPFALQVGLQHELQQRGIADSHIALPVHPWQFEHVLEAQLGDAFAKGDCQRLDFTDGDFFATSSLRSMTPCFNSADYLKLPMAIYSLGASRYLPAVKMINGGLSEALLRQALSKDQTLQQSLHLCDETKWWAFMPPDATLFDEAPRHLSAMVRGYPPALLEDPDTRLVPMAALGTPLPGSNQHFFDDWMAYRQLPANAGSVMTLFRELCHSFFDINLRMFRIGMLGEIHGQNAVLVWKAGYAQGLLLRDHDSLRIFVPWLERNGLADPAYRLKKGHANTLYHDRPEDLLFWLQTLGIQVNLRAIIDTLAEVYALPAAQLWTAMGEVLNELIDTIEFDAEARTMIKHQLFEAPHWPQKLLLTPMIERAGGPGSMPFGKGQVVNPFHRLDRNA